MRWGQHVDRFERERRAGKDSPAIRAALDDGPRLFADLQSIWSAFNALSSGRGYTSAGMTAIPAPITFEAIDRYATRHSVDNGDDFARFYKIIRTLDQHYLTDQAKSQRASMKAKK